MPARRNATGRFTTEGFAENTSNNNVAHYTVSASARNTASSFSSINQENNMTNEIAINNARSTDLTTVSSHEESVFSRTKAVTLREDQIVTDIYSVIGPLFQDGIIVPCVSMNKSREQGVPAIKCSWAQTTQLGAAMAMLQSGRYRVQRSTIFEHGNVLNVIVLLDTPLDKDSVMIVERIGRDGVVEYSTYYANVKYNNLAQPIGIHHGALHHIDEALRLKLADYNNDVYVANEALRASKGFGQEKEYMDEAKSEVSMNVINRYVLLAWILLAQAEGNGPAFSVFTFAGSTEKWVIYRNSVIDRAGLAFINHQRGNAGLPYVNKQGETVARSIQE